MGGDVIETQYHTLVQKHEYQNNYMAVVQLN